MRTKQQYIRNAIEASFIRLLEERPFEKITVKDIVDDCGLTRNTFYNYFEDTYDVVDGFLREQFMELAERESSETELTVPQAMRAVAHFAAEQPKVVSHLFRSPKREELSCYFDRALRMCVGRAVRLQVGERRLSEGDQQRITGVYCHAATGLFNDWLRDGMKGSLIEELEQLEALFEGSLEQAIVRASAHSAADNNAGNVG